MNEHTFIIGSLTGTKAREMEPVKERVPGEFKHFLIDCFMNEHSIKKRRSGIMESGFEDGRGDSLAENSLPVVSLGLEMNERSVLCQQLRGPDRATVPRPGQRPDAMSVQVSATEGATGGSRTEHPWRAFKSGAAMPISERQLRRILARQAAGSAATAVPPAQTAGP